MKHPITLLILLLSAAIVKAQSGCTDSQAVNFDSLAIVNDGSCIYPPTSLSTVLKSVLDTPALDENSGIICIDENLWVQNDNPDSLIYRIDSLTNSVFARLHIHHSPVIDWEDITTGDSFVFIGDFGNNYGNRIDLHILKFNKSSLTDTLPVIPEVINFSYEDQTSFVPLLHNNSFDCEAFFYLNDSLHLFTKDWVFKQTKHYKLPAIAGTHVAELVDSFQINGLVTSATIKNGLVLLLGYDNTGFAPCFLWMMSDYQGNNFFIGNKRMFSLGSAAIMGQTEGICFAGNSSGYITNEKFVPSIVSPVPPQIRSFDLSAYIPQIHVGTEEMNKALFNVSVSNDNSLLIVENLGVDLSVNLVVNDLSGKEIIMMDIRERTNYISIETLTNGVYFVSVQNDSVAIFRSKIYKR